MRVAVYSCEGNEKEKFSYLLCAPYKFRFFTKDLSIETICLAEGFDTIIIPSPDYLNTLVFCQLHKLRIKNIIVHSAGKNGIPLEKAKLYDIIFAYIPVSETENKDKTTIKLNAEAMDMIIETLGEWNHDNKSRFDIG